MTTATRHALLIALATAAAFFLVALVPLLRDPIVAVVVEGVCVAVGACVTALVPEYGAQLGARHRAE